MFGFGEVEELGILDLPYDPPTNPFFSKFMHNMFV
jgi:hypothetical protein